jgi:DNA-binding NtrC family response regulator
MGLRVLIVDDETFLAEEIAAALDFMGLSAITAGSAREAVSILEAQEDIGVLVTDVRMPQENGMDLARHVLAGRDDSRAVDVILMTGCSTDIDVTGIVGCIGKPFLVEDLAAMVQKSIEAVSLRRTGQKSPAG